MAWGWERENNVFGRGAVWRQSNGINKWFAMSFLNLRTFLAFCKLIWCYDLDLFCKILLRSVNEILCYIFSKHSQTPQAFHDIGAILVWGFGGGTVLCLWVWFGGFLMPSSNFGCARSGKIPVLPSFSEYNPNNCI